MKLAMFFKFIIIFFTFNNLLYATGENLTERVLYSNLLKNLILNLHRMVKYPSKMEQATHHQM